MSKTLFEVLGDETEPLEIAGQESDEFAQLETFDEWAQYFVNLVEQEQSELWTWSDAALAYRNRFRGSFKALASSIPRSVKTLQSYAHTAEIFGESQRFPDVPYSIYRICAYTDEPEYWLRLAMDKNLSASELREAIAEETGKGTGVCTGRKIYCAIQSKIVSKEECTPKCLLRCDDVIDKANETVVA